MDGSLIGARMTKGSSTFRNLAIAECVIEESVLHWSCRVSTGAYALHYSIDMTQSTALGAGYASLRVRRAAISTCHAGFNRSPAHSVIATCVGTITQHHYRSHSMD